MLYVRSPLRYASALVVLVACGGDSISPPRGVRFISGAAGTDTILAVRPDPLVVEVRDAEGQVVSGADVTFTVTPAPPINDPNRRLYLCLPSASACAAFSASGSSFWGSGVTTTTDAAGVARVRVQHGRVAGAATVEVSVPSRGLAASASFETMPGNLASIAVSSIDTAIYVGASYDLSPRAADRYGNVRSEPVTVQPQAPAVATFAAAGRVTAVAMGRASFAISSGAVSRVAFVSVPPPGRLLGATHPNPTVGLILLNTDGTSRRTVATTPGTLGWGYPGWYPDGRITASESNAQNTGSHVVAFDTTSGARSTPIDPTIFSLSTGPTASRATGLMYFTGQRDGVFGIYRAGIEDASQAAFFLPGQAPSVSPDGTRLAYVSASSSSPLLVRDLATGVETSLGTAAYGPFWSPAGDLIAYLAGPPGGDLALHVVHPDGTGDRSIASSVYTAGSWSPDGQWIATYRVDVGIELVRVSDGVRLPIPQTRELRQVSWRP
jgi:hypothetical protein